MEASVRSSRASISAQFRAFARGVSAIPKVKGSGRIIGRSPEPERRSAWPADLGVNGCPQIGVDGDHVRLAHPQLIAALSKQSEQLAVLVSRESPVLEMDHARAVPASVHLAQDLQLAAFCVDLEQVEPWQTIEVGQRAQGQAGNRFALHVAENGRVQLWPDPDTAERVALREK